MKLATKEVIKNTPRIGATAESNDCMVTAKFFYPAGAATWYITEIDEAGEEAFGFTTLGDPQNAELGYISIPELQAFRGRFGLGIERDRSFRPRALSEVMDIVKNGGHV